MRPNRSSEHMPDTFSLWQRRKSRGTSAHKRQRCWTNWNESMKTCKPPFAGWPSPERSEEHTSELQSHVNLVCRLLLEKLEREYENLQAALRWLAKSGEMEMALHLGGTLWWRAISISPDLANQR